MVTCEQFVEWYREWQKNSSGLRLGQAFCNSFSVSDQVLFYTPDKRVAMNLILDNYVSVGETANAA